MVLTFSNSCKDKEQSNTKLIVFFEFVAVLNVWFLAFVCSLALISLFSHILDNSQNAYLALNSYLSRMTT